jgi:hypothetical protein
MSKSFSPSVLASILRTRDIEPDEEFTSAAGKDYGYVAAWELPDGDYLVAYGNNGETNYDVADDADDLACWLESPDLSALDTIIQTANVRGDIDAAAEDTEGPFYIVKTRSYYGPTEKSAFVETDDNFGGPRQFATYADAQEWIDAEEEGIYCTSHNESGAPSYVIVSE